MERLQEVVTDNAPFLEKFISCSLPCDGMVIRVINAPKLKTLGYLSVKIQTLDLGAIVFQVAAHV